MTEIKGSCLCGEIEFTVQDNFLYAGYCHCSKCRKIAGASGSAIGGLPISCFKLTKGEPKVKKFRRSENSVSCFCSICGSSLYGEKPGTDLVHVRYGSLDGSPTLKPQAHMHVASKAAWYEITDALPQFEEFPPM